MVRQDGKFGCFRELVLVLEAVTDRQMIDKRDEFSLGVCVRFYERREGRIRFGWFWNFFFFFNKY